MTSPKRFEETSLPAIEKFHDTLKDQPLSQADYDRARQTWSRFSVNTMKDFHDHYLLRDVLLLSDVFQHFKKSVFERHKLDCLHFITMPSLAWAMALRHTGAKIENSLRGGIATISRRYASANNHFVKDQDKSKPSRFVTYLDANSLYATAQSEPLPVGNFSFLDEWEIKTFDLDKVSADSETGYIIQCDIQHPIELHDLHNDYPMASEHLTVTRDMLSPYSCSRINMRE